MFDILSQSAKTDTGRWTQWRQSLRQWLKQDSLENTFRGMARPSEGPMFFRSTVLFDPIEAFANLDVPVLILDAAGRDDKYRDTTPIGENERLQKLHPTLIQHRQLPTGHFVHREAPADFVTALVLFQKRLQVK